MKTIALFMLCFASTLAVAKERPTVPAEVLNASTIYANDNTCFYLQCAHIILDIRTSDYTYRIMGDSGHNEDTAWLNPGSKIEIIDNTTGSVFIRHGKKWKLFRIMQKTSEQVQ